MSEASDSPRRTKRKISEILSSSEDNVNLDNPSLQVQRPFLLGLCSLHFTFKSCKISTDNNELSTSNYIITSGLFNPNLKI